MDAVAVRCFDVIGKLIEVKWRICESIREPLPRIVDDPSCRHEQSPEQEDRRGWGP